MRKHHLELHSLPGAAYRLSRPLALDLHRTRDYYWVAPPHFVLYGVGKTVKEAVEDYGYALLGYYEDLVEAQDILAPHLAEHLAYLQELVILDDPQDAPAHPSPITGYHGAKTQ